MAIRVEPYHCYFPTVPDVYHVFSDCPDGLGILPTERREGMRDLPLCQTCQEMQG